MGHFVVKSSIKLHDLNLGDIIQESDFACISGDKFVQLEYIETKNEIIPFEVTPGIWTMAKTMAGLTLKPTVFSADKLLEDFIHTKVITDKVNAFFNKLHVYAQFGIEVPKRCILLYGPAGSGKSAALGKVCKEYAQKSDVAVILWKTDVIDPYEVKEFIKRFQYIGVEKLILVAEDIGGIEMDQVRIKSESSLLSLFDNQEKAFTKPVMIIATTNYPENLLANLTNRPQRIDDKIEIGYPSSEARKQLFRFFGSSQNISEEIIEKIGHKKYADFTPAHIKELFVRSAIYDLTLEEAMNQIAKEIQLFKTMFQEKLKLGIGIRRDDGDDY